MLNIEIPDASDVGLVADWIELNVVYTQSPLSKATLSSLLEGALGSEPSEAFLSSVWDELALRIGLYGDNAPIGIEPLIVLPNISENARPEYVMCLILSLVGNSSNPTPTGKLFERVVREAVQNYINGNAIVFGHPDKLTIQEVCQLTNERFRQELPARYKDRGLDIIAWRPFNDERGNQVVILMQCAGGKNWTSKTGDIVLRSWEDKIAFGCTPTRGFATVVTISNQERFEEVSFEAGLLFDRPRIYRSTTNLNEELREELRKWCANMISSV